MKKLKQLLLLGALALTVTGCQTTGQIETKDEPFGLAVTGQGDASRQQVLTGAKNYAAGNYGLAEKSFRLAVEATPDNAQAWLGLAASYDQLGRFDMADRAYTHLLKQEGRKASILNNQAYSLILRGENKKALPLLREAANMVPGNKIIDGNLAIASKG